MNQHLPSDQSERNKVEALRVMALVPNADFTGVKELLAVNDFEAAICLLDRMGVPNPDNLCPEPKVIIRAEIVNAKRYSC